MDNFPSTSHVRIRRAATRSGMSLLELILALALSGMILYACSMAIDLHLRTLDSRRLNLEEAQLARSVLNMISADLRSTLRYQQVDMSAVEQLATESLANAAAGMLGDVAGGGAGGPAGGGSGGGPGGGGSGGAPGGGAPGGGGTGGSGGSGGAGPGGGGPGGGSSGGTGGSGQDDLGGSETDPMLEESQYTGDLANATALPPVIGLYGNSMQLQIDISRLPRVDEYQVMASPQSPELAAIPSDVKTVTYFLQSSLSGTGLVSDPLAEPQALGQQPAQGLVRRQVDRSVALFAIQNGQTDALMRTGELIAPEVTALEFQYFDGLTWLPEWDSQQLGGLPIAVAVTIAVTPQLAPGTTLTQAQLAAAESDVMIYRTVVPLPLGELPAATTGSATQDAATSEGLENLGL